MHLHTQLSEQSNQRTNSPSCRFFSTARGVKDASSRADLPNPEPILPLAGMSCSACISQCLRTSLEGETLVKGHLRAGRLALRCIARSEGAMHLFVEVPSLGGDSNGRRTSRVSWMAARVASSDRLDKSVRISGRL